MNVVNRLTLRHLKLNKKRTIVTIIGVILSVAMITGVTTFVTSAQNMMIEDEIGNNGNWHAMFPGIKNGNTGVFRESDAVRETMYVRDLGYAVLDGATTPHKPYLFIQELDQDSLGNLGLTLVEGRFPESADELAISEQILYSTPVRLKVGDRLELTLGQRMLDGEILGQEDRYHLYYDGTDSFSLEEFVSEEVREYTIVGVIKRPGFESHSAPGYSVLSFLDRASLTEDDQVSIFVQFAKVSKEIYGQGRNLAAGAGLQGYVDSSGQLRYNIKFNQRLLALHGVSENNNYDNMIYVFALVAIVVIMLGSVSLIYNAFAISISERSRQLGMMASAGATKGQKCNSVFYEGMVIGLIGIPLGLLAGIGGMAVTFRLVDPLLTRAVETTARLHLVVSLPSVLAAVFFSALTILVSVWIPARRASRISPIDAIRQTQDIKLKGRTVRTSRLTRKIFGFEGELALKNLKRNRRRYRATVVSLSISIILFLTVTAYVTYGMAVSDISNRSVNYDLSVRVMQLSREEKLDLYKHITALDLVDKYAIELFSQGAMQVEPGRIPDYPGKQPPGEDGQYRIEVIIVSRDEDSFKDFAKASGARLDSFSSGKPAAIAVNAAKWYGNDMFVETEVIKARAGDTLSVDLKRFQPGEHVIDINLAAITAAPPMGASIWNREGQLLLIVPEHAFEYFCADLEETWENSGTLYLNTAQPENLEKSIRKLHRETSQGLLHVHNHAASVKQMETFRTLVMVFAMGFIALIAAICIANILNTISTSIGLRRREFAVLKSVGMTGEGFNRMIRYESIFYGIQALSIGLPISLAINYILYQGISEGFYFSFTLPWASYSAAIISVFAVVFATMLYSSARIKRENIIDALRDENM